MRRGRGSKIAKCFYKIMIDENTRVNTNPHHRVFVDMGRIESTLFIKKYLSTDVIDKSSDYLVFTQLSDEIKMLLKTLRNSMYMGKFQKKMVS